MTAICIAIFALVAAVIIYSLINFRARPDEDEDGPPIHGHTGLEIAWTAVPAVLVTAIAIVSAIVLGQNGVQRLGLPNRSTADVERHRAAVRLELQVPGLRRTSTRRRSGCPIDAPVKLEITSLDVIHSFWVPEFARSRTPSPGRSTRS